MPTNEEIESKVKQLLFLFTRRYTKEPGKQNILSAIVSIHFACPSDYMYTFIKKRYIAQISEEAKQPKLF